MDAVQEIRDAFAASAPELGLLYEYLREQIGAYCEDHGYVMKHRLKALPSVAAKLQQGRYESWSALDDLVAFTVVVPTRGYEAAVSEWLDTTFEHHDTRNRQTVQKPPDTFRFDATRWYGRVAESSIVLPEHEGFRRFLFEVQIRTAFEDAWGVVTHDLVYKGDDPTWGKARLASQLKAAVEQIDEIVENFEANASQLPSSPHRQSELILAAIAKLKQLFIDGMIDDGLEPNSWTSLANNLWAFSRRQPTADSGGYRRPDRVFPGIVGEFDRSVRAGEFQPLLSATLFDAVVACAILDGRAVSDEFFLVRSETIETTLGLQVKKPIDLDPAFEAT